MDQHYVLLNTTDQYSNIPILYIPKKCTNFETNCDDNIFIDLNISSTDTEGNDTCIYSGYCNVKLTNGDQNVTNETFNNNINELDNSQMSNANMDLDNQSPSHSQVWIDPIRSPLVYNRYDENDLQGYSINQNPQYNDVSIEQQNTYIAHNIYNYNDNNNCGSVTIDEFEHKKFGRVQVAEMITKENTTDQVYEEDEYQCGIFLSQLSEEILNEKEFKQREERRYIGMQTDNGALKQLMSPKIQSLSKQHRTILFLGHDAECGQTVQKIAIDDPYLQCSGSSTEKAEVVSDQINPNIKRKKYQCENCKQIFDCLETFKQHVIRDHRGLNPIHRGRANTYIQKYSCIECGRKFRNREKFENHRLGHRDPELKCNKCHKVFASRFTLRAHYKIHDRNFVCNFCAKSYTRSNGLRNHLAKKHYVFMCEVCDVRCAKYSELLLHQKNEHGYGKKRQINYKEDESDEDIVINSFENENIEISEEHQDSVINYIVDVNNDGVDNDDDDGDARDIIEDDDDEDIIKNKAVEEINLDCSRNAVVATTSDNIKDANAIIAKVIANKMFLRCSKTTKTRRKYDKVCDVCHKAFDRVGDLKRHLIEHVVRSTLAKTPANKNRTLKIVCEICQVENFTKIDKYKAHLREHAKLTIYKCTFCDKSFSDSSNFSKHKKIHGAPFFQCDLCNRKFSSKKMIIQHIEYHNKNSPISCKLCNKTFHFKSMLNKHVKIAHGKKSYPKVRCKFCHNQFRTLKEKWDHEWLVHNIRKMIVDCLVCGAKFRKYSELKRHCNEMHNMEIPSAKKLLLDNASD